MPDYAPVNGGDLAHTLTLIAGAPITGGQLLAFTAADTVSPTSGATLAFAGVAGHDAATGAPVTVFTGSGLLHETPALNALGAPLAPVPTQITSGGTVLAGVYGVIVSYVTATGETVGSAAGFVTTTGSTSTITVPSPAAATGATGWYAYVTQANGSTYTRQQTAGSPTAIATPLSITTPPTSGGLAPQASNTTGVAVLALVAAAAGGLITGGAAAGSELGVVVRGPSVVPGVQRWKTTRG